MPLISKEEWLPVEGKQKFALQQLEEYKQSGAVKAVEILDARKDSCDACRKNGGKKFTLEEAIANPPIPVRNCTHEYGCRCVFLPITMSVS